MSECAGLQLSPKRREVYVETLARARADFARATERLAVKKVELDKVETRVRRLRAVIFTLAVQLGEESGLPEESPVPRRRKSR